MLTLQSYAADADKPGAFFGPCSQVKPRTEADVLLSSAEIERIKKAYLKCATSHWSTLTR